MVLLLLFVYLWNFFILFCLFTTKTNSANQCKKIAVLYLTVLCFIFFPDYVVGDILLFYRNGSDTFDEDLAYLPDPTTAWQTIAVGFNPLERSVLVWTSNIHEVKKFKDEYSSRFALPFTPNRYSGTFCAAFFFFFVQCFLSLVLGTGGMSLFVQSVLSLVSQTGRISLCATASFPCMLKSWISLLKQPLPSVIL